MTLSKAISRCERLAKETGRTWYVIPSDTDFDIGRGGFTVVDDHDLETFYAGTRDDQIRFAA